MVKRTGKVLLWLGIGLGICLLLGARTTYDYGLQCTKCLSGKHVVEKQFLGIPFWRTTKDRGKPADYERIFGRPCEHVYRKGGFGLQRHGGIACGMTGEGAFFRERMSVVRAVFDAERKFHEPKLALESFTLIDVLMPPDTELSQSKSVIPEARGTLYLFASYLKRANASSEWQAVLDSALEGFKETDHLPKRDSDL